MICEYAIPFTVSLRTPLYQTGRTKSKIEFKFAHYAMHIRKYFVILVTSNLKSSVHRFFSFLQQCFTARNVIGTFTTKWPLSMHLAFAGSSTSGNGSVSGPSVGTFLI